MKRLALLVCLVALTFVLSACQQVLVLSSPSSLSSAPTPVSMHQTDGSVLGPPTLTAAFIDQVLASLHSPALGLGSVFYSDSLKYGIDDAFPLAFFQHESNAGTTGEARVTLSIGNERCIQDRPCIDQDRGGYAQMYSWSDGIDHWYSLIKVLYVEQWHRTTVAQIIPKYAPSSDGNNEGAYEAAIIHTVSVWRSGRLHD